MKKSKILVSTALALCMGATAVTPAFAADNESFTFTKIGDYNADNAVSNISDVTALQKLSYLAFSYSSSAKK
ncbi:MAG: hypothetical protein V8T30_08830 [Ruminococcus sp.]